MKVIKFRAWFNDEMHDEILLVDYQLGCPLNKGIKDFLSHDDPDNPTTLMQFTGFKDENGKGDELYAGDILKDDSPRGKFERKYPARGIGVIVWSDREAAWCLELQDSTGMKMRPLLHNMISKYNRKIGNVHQNPDLLNA